MDSSTKKIEQPAVEFDSKKIFNMLKNIKFFKDRNIQNSDLHILEQGFTLEEMKQDDYVFKFGSYGDKFYLILKGSVRILIPVKDKTQKDYQQNNRKSIFDQTEVKK